MISKLMIADERGNKRTVRPIKIIDTVLGVIIDFAQPHRWYAHASLEEGSRGPTAATNAAVLFWSGV